MDDDDATVRIIYKNVLSSYLGPIQNFQFMCLGGGRKPENPE